MLARKIASLKQSVTHQKRAEKIQSHQELSCLLLLSLPPRRSVYSVTSQMRPSMLLL